MNTLFPCQLMHFPCKYLGIPLSVQKLKKVKLLPLVDMVVDRLPTWKARFIMKAGWTTLTRVTLSAIPVHVSIVVVVSPWIYQAIDKIRCGFIWVGVESVSRECCLMAWSKVMRLIKLNELGILDLTTSGYGLCMRWEWLARIEPDHIWASILGKSERMIRAMFVVSTMVQVGNGARTMF
jgi:hypothetical protein